MNFFKSPKKNSKKPPTSDEESNSSRSRSPPKKTASNLSATSAKPSKPRDENTRPAPGSSRSSRNLGKSGQSTPRSFADLNEHPLNLPPDQLRRLSALSNKSPSKMSDSDRMDVDSEPPARSSPPYVAPASPPPQANVPGAFEPPKPTPKVNGTSKTENEGPVPPPHKSNPASPVAAPAPTPEDAEAFKAAGNKLYKAREYKKAIEEYTKGLSRFKLNILDI